MRLLLLGGNLARASHTSTLAGDRVLDDYGNHVPRGGSSTRTVPVRYSTYRGVGPLRHYVRGYVLLGAGSLSNVAFFVPRLACG